jgi:hypothetical protein
MRIFFRNEPQGRREFKRLETEEYDLREMKPKRWGQNLNNRNEHLP